MADRFNLEKVKFVLDKKEINNIPCQVRFGMDASGSMRNSYENGSVQQIVNMVFAIAMSVDLDKQLDIAAFDTRVYPLPTITEDNIVGYVDKHITRSGKCWGGTDFAPIVHHIIDQHKENMESWWRRAIRLLMRRPIIEEPTLGIIITDGEYTDVSATNYAIESSKKFNIFWQIVCINMSDSMVDSIHYRIKSSIHQNLSVCGVGSVSNLDPDKLYENIISDKFAAWIKNPFNNTTTRE